MTGNKAHKLMGAGAATLIAEPALAMAHQGGLGIIVGLVIGAVAYGIVDEVEQRGGQLALPVLNQPLATEKAQRGSDGKSKPNLAHRLLVGKSVREAEAATADDEADTVLIDEDEDLEGDEERAPDTLELGDLRPHADTVFSHRIAILGMPGAGKSNLIADLVEELGQFDAPLIVLDHKPEYGPLCQRPYLTNPQVANAQDVTPQNAAARGQEIMEKRLQVVVDLSSYRDDVDAALVMANLAQGVLRYQKARENGVRIPCTFVLDEAHYWLPENEAHSTIRRVKHPQTGQTLLAFLQQVFFHVAKLGRSFGMGLIVATQRPADVDKRLISSADWRFLLKAMEPADLDVYRRYGLADSLAQALNPKAGEAYVIGPDESRGVYHIRRRYSPDVAKSPGLANIRNAAPVSDSPIHDSPERGAFERTPAPVNRESVNGESIVNRPEKRVNGGEWDGEYSPRPVNAVNAVNGSEEQTGYSHAEEMQVVLAYAELVKSALPGDPPITRTAIMKHLEWNTKHYQRIVKPVCDKHGIALRES
jgi:Helicase HerA, central domain